MKLRDNFDVVGDVRGQGLMLGLELVADRVAIHSHMQFTQLPDHLFFFRPVALLYQ